jgi:hypothetical protein
MQNFDGDAVTRDVITTIIDQQQIRFNATVAKLSRNIRIHKLWVFDAIRADKIQRSINKVRREHQILLARENFLDTPIVVKIDVSMFMFLNDYIKVQSGFFSGFEFCKKSGKFFSSHLQPFKRFITGHSVMR